MENSNDDIVAKILSDRDVIAHIREMLNKSPGKEKGDLTPSEVYKTAVNNIKKTREEKGISQKRMAEAIGVSTNHVSAIERGEKKGSFEVIIAMSRVLKTPLSVLAHDDDKTHVMPELSLYISKLSQQEQERVLSVLKAMYGNGQ